MNLDDMNFDIKPTDDYVFKRLFGDEENKDILISFLNAIFKEYDFLPEINDLKFENNEITKDFGEGRNGRLDVKATTNNGDIVDIEIQSIDTGNLINRGIFYNSWLMATNVKKGSNLEDIPRVISIWIIKNEPRKDNIFYKHKSPIELNNIKSEINRIDNETLTTSDKFNIIFIFLSKIKDGLLNKNLENWLKFIDNQSINGVKDNNIIKAIDKMDIFRGDKNMKESFESQMKYTLNRNTDISIARNDGKKEGIKVGEKKGREEGLKVGIEKGIEKGEKNKSIEIARNMLKEGLDIKLISKLSGLSIEEIKKLK